MSAHPAKHITETYMKPCARTHTLTHSHSHSHTHTFTHTRQHPGRRRSRKKLRSARCLTTSPGLTLYQSIPVTHVCDFLPQASTHTASAIPQPSMSYCLRFLVCLKGWREKNKSWCLCLLGASAFLNKSCFLFYQCNNRVIAERVSDTVKCHEKINANII